MSSRRVQLMTELEDARIVLSRKQDDLDLAARIGKKLLEENSELYQKYETAVQEYSTTVEVWEIRVFMLARVTTAASATRELPPSRANLPVRRG